MTASRSIVIAVVLAVVITSGSVASVSFAVLSDQFARWEHHLGVESWSYAARALRRAYYFGPVLPLVLTSIGIGLARSRECQATQLVWYACASMVITVVWALWAFVVLHSFYVLSQPV